MNITSPIGTSPALTPSGSLTDTLAGLRCDYAALVGLSLSAVTIPGGSQINTANSSAAVLASAIAAANAVTTCAPASRALLGVDSGLPAHRRLQSVQTTPWAGITVHIGASTSASGAASIGAKVLSAAASAFPRTISAWAPVWGLTAPQWLTNVGSPVALASPVSVNNAASFSPQPAAPGGQVLSNSQQLGLGLGIALPLALFIVLALISSCRTHAIPRAAHQLHVVAPKAAAV